MSSTGVLPSDVAAQLLMLTQQGAGTSTTILKKALQADKDLVTALLPAGETESGRVNIPA